MFKERYQKKPAELKPYPSFRNRDKCQYHDHSDIHDEGTAKRLAMIASYRDSEGMLSGDGTSDESETDEDCEGEENSEDGDVFSR
jgi:hypothetical protein